MKNIKDKMTRLSFKIWMYILMTIGFLIACAGIIVCSVFGSYIGMSHRAIEQTFYDDAIEKYSIAAVTKDTTLDVKNSNFRYAVIRGISKKDLLKAAGSGASLPTGASVVSSNLSSKETDIIKNALKDGSSAGHTGVKEYMWSDKLTYRLQYDRGSLSWPLSLGKSYINRDGGNGYDIPIDTLALFNDKKGLYFIDGNNVISVDQSVCDAMIKFQCGSYSTEISPYEMSYDDALKKAKDFFKENSVEYVYDGKKHKTGQGEINISISLTPVDEYGKYTGSERTIYSSHIKTMDSADAEVIGRATAFDGDLYNYELTHKLSDTYCVVYYVPEALAAEDDLFNRIAPAVTEVIAFNVAGILAIIVGVILCLVGFILFVASSGHAKMPLDLMTFIYFIVFMASLASGLDVIEDYTQSMTGIYLAIAFTAIYVHSLVANIRAHGIWRRTVIYRIFAAIRNAVRKKHETEYLRKEVSDLYRRSSGAFWMDLAINIVTGIIAVYGGFRCGYYYKDGAGFIVIALVIFIIKEAVSHRKMIKTVEGFGVIKQSAREIANGNMEHRAGTAGLSVDERQVVDDLNSINSAIDVAVDERIKSEHMQTELITNVSHDIRTPLTSIINYTDLLSKPDATDEQKKEYIEILKKQGGKLKKLINDLIDASKAESGKIELHPENINAATMVSMMAGEYEEKLASKNVTLETSGVDDDEAMINADPNYIGRVFQNLFVNMYKYSQSGTRAYVDLEKRADKVVIVFRNISSERLHISADELTERFVRGDISRTTEGSGLGLSIAKRLTELMGGDFRLTIDGDLFKVELIFTGVAKQS